MHVLALAILLIVGARLLSIVFCVKRDSLGQDRAQAPEDFDAFSTVALQSAFDSERHQRRLQALAASRMAKGEQLPFAF